MTWLPEWLAIVASLAALLWPLPLLNAWAMDWQDKRAYERRRDGIMGMEGLNQKVDAAGDLKAMH